VVADERHYFREIRELSNGSALWARGFERTLVAVLFRGAAHPDGDVLLLDSGREIAQCLRDCLSKTGVVGMELDTEHGADPAVIPRQAYEIFTHEFHGFIVANSGLV
jgi:hypothetical protein